MNLELLNLVIALCVGSLDTQSCHKKYFDCVKNQTLLVAKTKAECKSLKQPSPENEACNLRAEKLEKNLHTAIAECQ